MEHFRLYLFFILSDELESSYNPSWKASNKTVKNVPYVILEKIWLAL